MIGPQSPNQTFDYEGFEIHVAPVPADDNRYTYTAWVCHPGADAALPGHAVPFHPGGDDTFRTEREAVEEAVHVGRSIVDGSHPDLSVLSLVTHGF